MIVQTLLFDEGKSMTVSRSRFTSSIWMQWHNANMSIRGGIMTPDEN
jgi:hypothetical protein